MEGHLGKYEIRRTLGRGAAGTVYEAWDPIIARQVAIKTVKLPDSHDIDAQEELARFRREAQAAGRLTHPNIVGVFDYGETADIAYIVMEYVDGESLKAVLDRKERFAVPDIVRIMDELLAGLGFSHERGVVHRDIKPANLMLTRQGRIKIADFGIARIESSGLTQVGTIMGTPAYMSPEQFTGQVVDPRTDLYSAGVVLYQLLTGERPFEGSMTAIMQKALNTVPSRPSEIAVTAPVAFDAVVQRAMAKRPEQRFPTAAAFAQALHAAQATPVDSESDATVVQVPAAAPPPVPPAPPAEPAPPPRAAPQLVAAPLAPASAAEPASRSGVAMFGGIGAAIVAAGAVAWFLFAASPQAPTVPPVTIARAPESMPAPPANPPPAARAGEAGSPSPPSPPAQESSAVPPPAATAAIVAAPTVSTPTMTPPAVQAPVAPQSSITALAPQALPHVDRNALVASLAAIPCAMLDGELSDTGNTLSLNGVIADGTPRTDLTQVLATSAAGLRTNLDVQSFPQSADYCRALDVLRPVLPRFGDTGARLELRIADGKTRLTTDAPIKLRVTMPDFAGELRVEYLSSDGNIYHVHPAEGMPQRVFQAGQDVKPGLPNADGKVGEVGEPYGSDMIIAVASTTPLFSKPRPKAAEPAGPFLKDLQTAIEAARRRGTRIAADVMILETAAR